MEAVLLPIVGVLIDIFLIILFFTKKTSKNDETILFSKILLSNFTFIIIGIFTFVIAKITNNLYLIGWLQKIYMCFLMSMDYYAVSYCLLVSKEDIQKNNIYRKILNIITTIAIFLTLILPIKAIFYENVLDGEGLSYDVAIIHTVICFLAFLILTIISFKKKKNIVKNIPFLVFIILYIIGFVLRKQYPELIFEGFFFAYILLIMYNTIENPDVKMLDMVYKNRQLVENSNQNFSNILFKLSTDIQKPLQDIIKLTEDSNDKKMNLIQEKCNELDFQINKALNLSEMDIQNVKTFDSKYNVQNLFKEIHKNIQDKINQDILINYEITNNLPEYCYGDGVRIKQIIMGVVTNAIKHTEKGNVKIEINTIIRYDVCRFLIDVTDEAGGIEIDKINQILNVKDNNDYPNLDSQTDNLTAIKLLVNKLGGSFMIKSHDKSTIVNIVLDQKVVQNEDIQNNNIINKYANLIKKESSVLLVDNNMEEVLDLTKYLETFNFMVSCTISGKDLIAKITHNEKFDLIILNDVTNDLSAYNIMKELLKIDNFNIPTIVLIEKEQESIKKHYLEDGFSEVIIKNKMKSELKEILPKYQK